MTLWPLLVFAAALAIAAASPGPAIVTLVARVLAFGVARNVGFAVGLLLGDLVWLGCGVFGAAALATQAHELFVALKYAGAAYLLYLAIKLWTAPPAAPGTAARGTGRDLWGGLSVALANPKTMMFYLALVPSLVDVTALDVPGFAALCLIVVAVYGGVLAAYIAAAARARRLFTSTRALRAAHRGGSVILTGAAATVALRA
jgi:threonine/homoserine/homoserine lactone efflux protein